MSGRASPLWAAAFPMHEALNCMPVEHKNVSKWACVYLFLLFLTIDIAMFVSWLPRNNRLWPGIVSCNKPCFLLNCFLSGYFITATETKLGHVLYKLEEGQGMFFSPYVFDGCIMDVIVVGGDLNVSLLHTWGNITILQITGMWVASRCKI